MKENSYFENELSIINQLLSDRRNFRFLYKLSIIASFLSNLGLLVIHIPFRKKIEQDKFVAFARVGRVKEKLTKVLVNTYYIEDEIRKMNFSIFHIGPRKERIKFILCDYVKFCKMEYKILSDKILLENNQKVDENTIAQYLMIRIPHAMVYKFAIEQTLAEYQKGIVFTGQMYDYYAQIEKEVCHLYNKQLICFPHGIESTQKLPLGYSGDVFFASSQKMANLLNNLYNTQKFLYRKKINERLYKVNSEISKNLQGKVVFFTQPLMVETTKIIIRKIAQYLKSQDCVLYIKVHPLESSKDYIIENTILIDNFTYAISNSLCISLVSTILLEAGFNNSEALSIVGIVDGMRYENYPYLDQNTIPMPNSEEEVFAIIDLYLNV
ncbi:MAG: hypothetical protein JEY71_13585 [Sphaerochaeta sp.]|nr:hypothetical protein [Sphaerochaeta sp.]